MLIAYKYPISGSISLRFAVLFHLSLTLLFHYRCIIVFSLGSLVLPYSNNFFLIVLLIVYLLSKITGLIYLLWFSFYLGNKRLSSYSFSLDFRKVKDRLDTSRISLTATLRISIDFFSSCYLDVSVHRVVLFGLLPFWLFLFQILSIGPFVVFYGQFSIIP